MIGFTMGESTFTGCLASVESEGTMSDLCETIMASLGSTADRDAHSVWLVSALHLFPSSRLSYCV